MYDLIIIGGGPAGAASAVYAARKKLKTLLLTESFGGQSLVSDGIENWIGTPKISGYDLALALEKHVREYSEEVEIKMPEKATAVREIASGFEVATDAGKTYQGKMLMVASGGRRRRLGVPGEDKYDGKGVAFCATCDAPIFKGKEVIVVGSGNSALESVVDLFPYAKKITLLIRGDVLKGDPLTQDHINERSDLVTVIFNTEVTEVFGDNVMRGAKVKNNKTGEMGEIKAEGLFVEIGSAPNSEFMKGLVEINPVGEIIIDHKFGTTSKPGIFAAGDVTDEIYKQNNISVGDAVKATLSAYNYYLKSKRNANPRMRANATN